MRKTSLLKEMIKRPSLLVMPGAYDALSARLIEEAGFEALQCSGGGISSSFLGLTDASLTSMAEIIWITKNIVQAVDIPVMADGDTGFGNAVNAIYMVQQLETIGAAGVNIEDQVFPKRCGHMQGKELVTLEEMVKKIEAMCDSKKDPDFVINARTDAIAVEGIEKAIERGNAYARAGADLIFVESPRSLEEIKLAINEIEAPVSINMLEGGKTPMLTFKELEELGAARVSCPLTTLLASVKAVKDALAQLKEQGTTKYYLDSLADFDEVMNIVKTSEVRELEKKYLPA